jgi:hypothetical protein
MRILRKAMVAYFQVVFQHFFEDEKENKENLSVITGDLAAIISPALPDTCLNGHWFTILLGDNDNFRDLFYRQAMKSWSIQFPRCKMAERSVPWLC